MTTIAHTAIGLLGWQKSIDSKRWKTLLLFVVVSSLPDIDFGLFFFMGTRGFSFHQYYTHNVFFVLFTCLICFFFVSQPKERLGLLLTGFSHLALDFLTIDGAAPYGFPLFYPFSDARFNMGVLPNIWKANLSEIFSLHNVWVVGFEVLIFWVPLILIYRKELLSFFMKKNYEPAPIEEKR